MTPANDGPSRRLLLAAVCCLGISAFLTQLTLLRELLSAFSGNELVLGIVLGCWMLLTGCGAAAGRLAERFGSPVAWLIGGQVVVAVAPPATVFALRALRDVVFLPGVEVDPATTVVACAIVLSPYCVATGLLLTLTCRLLAAGDDPAAIGRVYFLDGIGDVLGGGLFTFVLVHAFRHFAILYVPAALNLAAAVAVAAASGRHRLAAGVALASLGLAATAATADLERLSRRLQFPGEEVLLAEESPYGSLVVTRARNQVNFIESGVVLFAGHNVERAEETVHYAMAQRPEARRVLLVSGGIAGTVGEVLKYPVEQLDYVELDPMLLDATRRFLPERLDHPRLRVVEDDGRRWLKRCDGQYDVVILDVADPSTARLNRFYTLECFREARRALRADGVLCFSLGRYENYMSGELADLVAVARRTAEAVFRHVLVLPGGRVFFLASDGPLDADIASRVEEAGVSTRLVRREYLRGLLTPDRIAALDRGRDDAGPLNTDFRATLHYRYVRWWASRFPTRIAPAAITAALMLLAYAWWVGPAPRAILAGGFAASAVEVALLLALQALYGSVYRQVALVVTAFMFGLVVGAAWITHRLPRCQPSDLRRAVVALGFYCAVAPLGLVALAGAEVPSLGPWLIAAAAWLLGALVGVEFPLAALVVGAASGSDGGGPRVSDRRRDANDAEVTATASRLYAADYLGAAAGALAVSTLLVPWLGLVNVCWLAAAVNLLCAGLLRRA